MSALDCFINGRRIAIFGIGKMQEDFEYAFQDISISFYVTSDNNKNRTHHSKPVYCLSQLCEHFDGNTLLVACVRDRNALKSLLEQDGYKEEKDFCFAEDLFKFLDTDWAEIIGNRKIAVWGTDKISESMANVCDKNIEIYIESNQDSSVESCNEAKICRPEELIDRWKEYFVVVAEDFNKSWETTEYLQSLGLKNKKDFASYHVLFCNEDFLPSKMMEKTYFDVPKNWPKCTNPFTAAYLTDSGDVTCCCQNRITVPYGNYFVDDFDQMWGSNVARIFRLSMINRTYSFCVPEKCTILSTNQHDPGSAREIYLEPAPTPNEVVMAFDSSCNLYCTSCRNEHICAKGRDKERLEFTADKIIRSSWFKDADNLTIAGNGEAFFSPVYRKMLFDKSIERKGSVTVFSNGILFTEDAFQELEKIYSSIKAIISIDGATKESYEKIRRGGKFDILMSNMRMLGKYRALNRLKSLIIDVTVQRDNYKELPLFVETGKEVNADIVHFYPIENWGTYTDEDFANVCMVDLQGGFLKPELLEVLRDSRMSDKIADMSWFRHRMEIAEGN